MSAQNIKLKQISLSPNVDTLFSNKDYLFKVENASEVSTLINVSLDTGYYLHAMPHYVSPNFIPGNKYDKLPFAYIRDSGNGFDLRYDTYLKLEGGNAIGQNDKKDGALCNAYITAKKNNVIDTVYKKQYYFKYVYDSEKWVTNWDSRYYFPNSVRAKSPKAYFGKIVFQGCPGVFGDDFVCKTDSESVNTILSNLSKKNPFTIYPKKSGFKIFYVSAGYGESKTEADVNHVFYKLHNRIANQTPLKWEYIILKIHLYNSQTGEYIKLPGHKVAIKY